METLKTAKQRLTITITMKGETLHAFRLTFNRPFFIERPNTHPNVRSTDTPVPTPTIILLGSLLDFAI